MKVPMWAQDLLLRVALDEGRQDVPDLKWRHTSSAFTGGITRRVGINYRPQITISAGRGRIGYKLKSGPWRSKQVSRRDDERMVLLHEITHWLAGMGEHHSPRFWDTAWRLYRTYRVPLRFALAREGNYRKAAVAAYRRAAPRKGG